MGYLNFIDPLKTRRLVGMKDGKSSGGSGGFDFQSYGGLRPPRIDSPGQEILRPTQKAIFDTRMRRSQGQDVGYDPAWLKLNTDLINSNANKSREDSIRDATGRLASSGLGGNARAQEALTGRVNRDADRTIGDSITALSVADLERKSQERAQNTDQLQALNSFNFGQEDKAADFDLNVYSAEQGGRLGAAGFNEGIRQYDQNQSDEFTNSLLQAGGTAAGMYFGGPAGAAVGGASAQALTSSGKGLAAYDPSMATNPYSGASVGGYRTPYKKYSK